MPAVRLRVQLSARFGARSRLDAGGWVAPGPRAEAEVFHAVGGKRDARFSLFSFLFSPRKTQSTYNLLLYIALSESDRVF